MTGVHGIAIGVYVCLLVYMPVHSHISKTTSVAVVRSSSQDTAIRYVPLVLLITFAYFMIFV